MPKIRVRKVSKNLKLFIIIFTILIMSPLAVSLAKYVYSNILDIYFASQDFYFESDKLKRDGTIYSLDYWNGVDSYEIAINLNSYKNNSLKSSTDIDYLVNYNCPSNVTCNVTKTKGTIYKSSNNDIFYLTITPKETFKDGESISVDLSALSTSPYKKSLSATFKLVVGKYGLSHEISDSSNNIYLEVKVTNTIESYTIKKAFSTYKIGDSISMDVYNSLTKEEKANCVSASITISFDPNVVYINNNSTTFLNGYDIKTTKINNYDYVNKFTFNMDANTSSVVKLYKKDKTKDYSNSGNSIVKVTYSY